MTGQFIHLTTAQVTEQLSAWLACSLAIANGHQAYAIAGRNITRANLKEVSDIIAELSYALSVKAGTLQRVVESDMSN